MDKTTRYKVGEIVTIARQIVGGIEFTTGQKLNPISIEDCAKFFPQLRKLLDEYDNLIIKELEKEDE